MGELLYPLTELGIELGCTIILLHHFRKSGRMEDDDPASIEELSMAGMGEWARQFILLQRRSAYQSDGVHDLWMRAGGSAGHAGLWGLHIEEGVINPETFEGRHWHVTIQNQKDIITEQKEQAMNEKASKRRDQEIKLLDGIGRWPEGQTYTYLREKTGVNAQACKRILADFCLEGCIEAIDGKKGRQNALFYRRTNIGK